TPNVGTAVGVFYLNNDVTKELKLTISSTFKMAHVFLDDIDNGFFRVDIVRYENGTSLDLKERINLYETTLINNIGPYNPLLNQKISVSYDDTITLLPGESLGLQWYAGGNFGGFLGDGDLQLDFSETVSTVNI